MAVCGAATSCGAATNVWELAWGLVGDPPERVSPRTADPPANTSVRDTESPRPYAVRRC